MSKTRTILFPEDPAADALADLPIIQRGPVVLQPHPAADIFPMMAGDAYERFKADVKEHGQRESIVVHDGLILDGRNRYRACTELGMEPLTRQWDGQGSVVAWVLSVNLHRRHLDESQRAMVAARALPMFAEEARVRQVASRAQSGEQIGRRSQCPDCRQTYYGNDHLCQASANLREPTGKATAQAASTVSVSPRSVESATQVLRKGVPELVQAVEAGAVAVSTAADVASGLTPEEQREVVARGEREILAAAKEIRAKKAEDRRQERIEKLAEIATGNAPLADAAVGVRYPVVYADPPWRYEHAESDSRAIENQYPTMTLDEICALPLADITTDDAILFLWATSPKLEEAMRVVREWGFTYRTCAVWDKERMGMGYYFRQQHELLLVATKGSIPTPPPDARPASVIRVLRDEKHSAKPSEVAAFIERMYPELPRLEMFCRSPREGWGTWGNQS